MDGFGLNVGDIKNGQFSNLRETPWIGMASRLETLRTGDSLPNGEREGGVGG